MQTVKSLLFKTLSQKDFRAPFSDILYYKKVIYSTSVLCLARRKKGFLGGIILQKMGLGNLLGEVS